MLAADYSSDNTRSYRLPCMLAVDCSSQYGKLSSTLMLAADCSSHNTRNILNISILSNKNVDKKDVKPNKICQHEGFWFSAPELFYFTGPLLYKSDKQIFLPDHCFVHLIRETNMSGLAS